MDLHQQGHPEDVDGNGSGNQLFTHLLLLYNSGSILPVGPVIPGLKKEYWKHVTVWKKQTDATV